MIMNYRSTLIAGIIFAGLGVAIGAFGAHGLKDILVANGRTDTFETAVRYQLYHAFALIATGIMQRLFGDQNFEWAALSFIAGIVIFSGSLYILCLSGIAMLGAITPIGGILFIFGWIVLVAKIIRTTR